MVVESLATQFPTDRLAEIDKKVCPAELPDADIEEAFMANITDEQLDEALQITAEELDDEEVYKAFQAVKSAARSFGDAKERPRKARVARNYYPVVVAKDRAMPWERTQPAATPDNVASSDGKDQ